MFMFIIECSENFCFELKWLLMLTKKPHFDDYQLISYHVPFILLQPHFTDVRAEEQSITIVSRRYKPDNGFPIIHHCGFCSGNISVCLHYKTPWWRWADYRMRACYCERVIPTWKQDACRWAWSRRIERKRKWEMSFCVFQSTRVHLTSETSLCCLEHWGIMSVPLLIQIKYTIAKTEFRKKNGLEWNWMESLLPEFFLFLFH